MIGIAAFIPKFFKNDAILPSSELHKSRGQQQNKIIDKIWNLSLNFRKLQISVLNFPEFQISNSFSFVISLGKGLILSLVANIQMASALNEGRTDWDN